MNNGHQASVRFPYLPVRVEVRGHTIESEALLDTGFDGYVAIPSDLVPPGARPNDLSRWALADGSTVLVPSYLGTVTLGAHGPFPAVVIAIGDELLVGAGAAKHVTIILDHGQRVIVEP